MAQAIITKYLAPTNTRGSRISVKSWRARTIYSWDYAMDVKDNHLNAITEHVDTISRLNKFCYRMDGRMFSLPDGSGYAQGII